jgi:transcriptional regulator with XRE-family HTH domain
MVARGGRRGKDDDEPQNALETFVEELKAQREAAGLTQEQLGKLMNYSPSLIARIETCRCLPSLDFAQKADEVLNTPGTFQRLRRSAVNGMYESWVRALLDMEERATVLRSWQPLVVPGLLQTEDYAREIIRSARPGDSDAQVGQIVAARMARQSIWEREDPPPPMLAVIIGEAVIRQRVGPGTVMRDQLTRLADLARSPRISVQLMPFDSDAHPGLAGAFVLASFDTGPDSGAPRVSWRL